VAQAADGVEIVNKMTCRASNVETLKFQYAETSTDPFSDTLPSLWVGTPIRISTTEQELTITDGDTRQLEDLKPMNGYYRCVASNKAGKFETLSATFRVILPCKLYHCLYLAPCFHCLWWWLCVWLVLQAMSPVKVY